MEKKKIVLELTVPEFLYIQEKVCFTSWGGFQWERDIEASVNQKLEAAYQKPVMSEEELEQYLAGVQQEWKKEGIPISNYIVAAERREKEFYFSIKESEKKE